MRSGPVVLDVSKCMANGILFIHSFQAVYSCSYFRMSPRIHFQVTVFKPAYEQLRDGNRIVQDVVEVAIAVMRSECCLVAGSDGECIPDSNVRKMVIVSCLFYRNLIDLSLEVLFKKLNLSKLKFFQSEFLVFPLPPKKHWTVVVVSNLALSLNHFSSETVNPGVQSPSCFYVLDSLEGADIYRLRINQPLETFSYLYVSPAEGMRG